MNKVALVTGAAKRIGASIVKRLHQASYNIALHYHHSEKEAFELAEDLGNIRKNSVICIQGNIKNTNDCQDIVKQATEAWGRMDVLINNASTFYATPFLTTDETQWEDLLGSNLKGPFFLSQAAAPWLKSTKGCIVNIADIHAEKPLKNYPIYCIAKAGLVMCTKTLAKELGPEIRVNAIAPGAILWPNAENALSSSLQQDIINRTCLKRQGEPDDIADTVLFLIAQNYITGQMIAVDGGRNLQC